MSLSHFRQHRSKAGQQGERPDPGIEDADLATTLIRTMTAAAMTLGVSNVLGLPSRPAVACAAVASIGYGGILFNRRSTQKASTAMRPGTADDCSLHRQREMHIALHTPDTIYSPRHIPSWFALACAAGAVNGFAFWSCREFVSHVTGTATRIGLEWHHLGIAVEYTLVLISFLMGATASVIWLQARACRGKRPRWATPLRAVALILAGAAVAGHNGLFGPFADQSSADPPFILLSVLAFAMGLQNAAVATTTGLSVRTTHLTGPVTDLGVHLGTAFFAREKERRDAFKGAALRAGKVAAFVIGGGLALPMAERFGYLALLAPASLISVAAVLSFLPDWSPSDLPFGRQRAKART